MTHITDTSTVIFTAIGAIATPFAAIFAIIGVIITARQSHLDNKYKKSQFYLEEIKSRFKKAVILINNADEIDNNTHKVNILWHQSVDLLKEAAKYLGDFLTEKSHQIIFISEYQSTAYAIVYILEKINLKNEQFFNKANISTDSLKWLCYFIDKASRVAYDIQYRETLLEDIFDQDYFKKANTKNWSWLDINAFLIIPPINTKNSIPPLYFIQKYIDEKDKK